MKRRKKTPAKLSRPGRLMLNRISLVTALQGFWFCSDCEQITERMEGEQGQPAYCLKCGSYRIKFHRPPTPVRIGSFAGKLVF